MLNIENKRGDKIPPRSSPADNSYQLEKRYFTRTLGDCPTRLELNKYAVLEGILRGRKIPSRIPKSIELKALNLKEEESIVLHYP